MPIHSIETSTGEYSVWYDTDDLPDGYKAVEERPSADHIRVDGAWVDNSPTSEDILDAWRAAAKVSQAQMRLALMQLGLTATIQSIADTDPAASVVWTWALEIRRSSPFIAALQAGNFTDEEIDAIFQLAESIVV